jgi:hypothetical protein
MELEKGKSRRARVQECEQRVFWGGGGKNGRGSFIVGRGPFHFLKFLISFANFFQAGAGCWVRVQLPTWRGLFSPFWRMGKVWPDVAASGSKIYMRILLFNPFCFPIIDNPVHVYYFSLDLIHSVSKFNCSPNFGISLSNTDIVYFDNMSYSSSKISI